MRLLLTALVFLAGLLAAVFVHAANADAAWERPQQIDSGHGPKLRLQPDGRPLLAYAQGDPADPSRVLVGEGNEPTRRVRVPRAGRVVAYDVDGTGRPVIVRESGRPRRLLTWDDGRWPSVSSRRSGAVDPELAVAGSGAAVLAWLQYSGRRVHVRAAVRQPGAPRFGPPQRISGPTVRAGQTLAVAVDDDGAAVVAFTERRDLWMWRLGSSPQRVHDATATTAGAFAAAAAIRGRTAVVAFTRLEDREPPEYRLSAATQAGDAAPVVETVATDVSALDVDAAVDADGSPAVLSAPIGPPYLLRLHRRTGSWAEAAAIPATEAPSAIDYANGSVTWTEGAGGFAWLAGQTLGLGRADDPAAAVAGGRAIVVWDRGPGRAMRLATFTP